MRTKTIETLRAMTREGILMYCADANREIGTLRESKAKLLRRVQELEAICATFDPKLRDPEPKR